MTPDQQVLFNTNARAFATRAVVAWLVAREARAASDPDDVLRELSEHLNTELDRYPEGAGDLKERIRAEIDATVSSARGMLSPGE